MGGRAVSGIQWVLFKVLSAGRNREREREHFRIFLFLSPSPLLFSPLPVLSG